jgi:hypothetical protein
MTLRLPAHRRPSAGSKPPQAGRAPRGSLRSDPWVLGDGWLGTRELPGYRAGCVVVKLDDLPEVAPDHLYFDLLLLDGSGQAQQTHSGPCQALAREEPLDERSRFVRVVAELVRHAPSDERGLTAIAPALDFIREGGIEPGRLVTAAQLLDNVCSNTAVAASLHHVLELSLGEEEARRALSDVVAKLARGSGADFWTPATAAEAAGLDEHVDAINSAGLPEQVSYVVQAVGKARARRYLREATAFELVPRADMFGV